MDVCDQFISDPQDDLICNTCGEHLTLHTRWPRNFTLSDWLRWLMAEMKSAQSPHNPSPERG